MATRNRPTRSQRAWELVRRQHGVIARRQLLALGYTESAIRHRVAKRRLHVVRRGVFSVGRREISRHGELLAAVLSCGPGAALSHPSAGELWLVVSPRGGPIHVSVPRAGRRRTDLVVHRRALAPSEVTRCHGIPVTTPLLTLVDLAAELTERDLIAAINEAAKHDLLDLEAARIELDRMPPRPGMGPLKRAIDRDTFVLTDSELERMFLPLVRRAGLPLPRTGEFVNGYKVDFYWPELGLVVETDGLRYHRTPAQQARDRLRDNAHLAAGLVPLRFTHAQIKHEPEYVVATLAKVAAARRLA